MTKVLVTESHLSDIAYAIRGKNGAAARYRPDEMAAAIQAIETPELEALTAIENGVYTPGEGKNGFSGVTVAVPNTYAASDEGKVVSGGALVAQTARAAEITRNGTYDTTENDSVTVNVAGSGSNKTYIVDPTHLLAAYNNNGGRRTVGPSQIMPCGWMAYFQSDNVYFFINGSDPYIRITRGNNKVIQFLQKIPAACNALYLDIAADAGSENYPISTLNIVSSLGISSFYSGGWTGTTLKSFTLTNTSAPDTQEGLIMTRTSARVVPRQVAQIDMTDITVDSYFTYFGCRSYFDIYGIWAE